MEAFKTWNQDHPGEKDPVIHDAMKGKITEVTKRRHIELCLFLSLTQFFSVQKGEVKICMAYNLSVSGLNGIIWTPSLMLTMME